MPNCAANGVDAVLWGPSLWRVLYAMALSWPDHRPDPGCMDSAVGFFRHLGNMLPCGACARHLKQEVFRRSDFISRDAFFSRVARLHNQVSMHHVNPPRNAWSLHDARRVHSVANWRNMHKTRVLRLLCYVAVGVVAGVAITVVVPSWHRQFSRM